MMLQFTLYCLVLVNPMHAFEESLTDRRQKKTNYSHNLQHIHNCKINATCICSVVTAFRHHQGFVLIFISHLSCFIFIHRQNFFSPLIAIIFSCVGRGKCV